MDHVAIDLGGRESQICVRSGDGKIVEELRLSTTSIGRYLGKRPRSRVIVETCTEAFAVADQAAALKHEVRVVPATLVKSLGVGARGIKTDQRDARILSEVSCRIDLPSVHVPSMQSRERKTLCGMREALVGSRTQLINTVRGWMRASHIRVRTGKAETFVLRVRSHLVGIKLEVPTYVQRQLKILEMLNEHLDEADKELALVAKTDDLCRRLMTVPGVGPVTAVRFAATLDQVGRFANAHAVESYLGLTPGEHSSSERQRRTSITKAGAPRMRWALVQAAWTVLRHKGKHPMGAWAVEVERRRGKRVAITALARKLAGILYAIWRDGTTYQAERTAQPLPPSAADTMSQALALLPSMPKG
jgi:transposase